MDFYKSLTILNPFLKMFSLHHITYNSNGFISTPWPCIKVSVMVFIFGLFLSFNIYVRHTSGALRPISPSVVVVDVTCLFLCYFEYIIDLYFVYKYRNEMCAYYNNYDQMDAVFKMKYVSDIKLSVTRLLATLLPSWLIASVGQFGVWVSAGGWLSPTTYAFSYFTLLIRLLTALDFISQIMHMRLRLKCITDHIEEFASFSENSVTQIKIIRNKTRNENKLIPCISKFRGEIGKASSCYLLLIEQEKFLNRFFGVRMLMHCLYTLIEMITFVNLSARVVSGAVSALMTSYVLLTPNILRFVNGIGLLSILVYYSETCRHECAEIIHATDHLLVNKRTSEEVKSSLKSLRKLVTSRPLKFSAAGFFNLESTLLLSITSVVITYALMIVQSTQ